MPDEGFFFGRPRGLPFSRLASERNQSVVIAQLFLRKGEMIEAGMLANARESKPRKSILGVSLRHVHRQSGMLGQLRWKLGGSNQNPVAWRQESSASASWHGPNVARCRPLSLPFVTKAPRTMASSALCLGSRDHEAISAGEVERYAIRSKHRLRPFITAFWRRAPRLSRSPTLSRHRALRPNARRGQSTDRLSP